MNIRYLLPLWLYSYCILYSKGTCRTPLMHACTVKGKQDLTSNKLYLGLRQVILPLSPGHTKCRNHIWGLCVPMVGVHTVMFYNSTFLSIHGYTDTTMAYENVTLKQKDFYLFVLLNCTESNLSHEKRLL